MMLKKIAWSLRVSNFAVIDHVSSLLFKFWVDNRIALMVASEVLRNGGQDMLAPPPYINRVVW